MRQSIRFILGGRAEEIHDCAPTETVLDFLRCAKGLKGTKEGCAEGDCGACTVVLGELDGDCVRYRAVNSCILFLPALDGKQLITVEDLKSDDGSLHAVQQAMVDHDGSQCGFCTPGFVMSMFAMFHEQPERAPTRWEIDLGLAGNLCRCTGYAPIVRATQDCMSAGRSDVFTQSEKQVVKALKSMSEDASLSMTCEAGQYFAPRTTGELTQILQQHPDATLVAGATDVGLWVTKDLRDLGTLVYTGQVTELKTLHTDDGCLAIGAAVTYTDALPAISEHYPSFGPVIERLGALQVRNVGTVGGNIANGSPIGDMPPGLIALGARLLLASQSGRRCIDLEDFFLDYGEQDLQPGEFVAKVLLPLPRDGQLFMTYKVSKRFEQDISAVCAGFNMMIENGIVESARVCFGGMAATPRRAAHCELVLQNQPWNRSTIARAMQALDKDFTPISDMRASAGYRLSVAQNLLQRFYLESAKPPHPVTLSGKYTHVEA